MSRGFVAVLASAAAVLALAGSPVNADYQGPDDDTSHAFGPLEGSHTYSATLNQDGSKPGDQDWYFFYVPTAGVRLHWTVTNDDKVTDCPAYQCNVYATLEDSAGQQLGGEGSSAGIAGAPPGTTQTIDWTFKSAGKYFIAFVGDGPKIAYHFKVTPADGVSGSAPGSNGSTTTPGSLQLSARQKGPAVSFRIRVPGGGGRLAATLTARTFSASFRAGSLSRSKVSAGTHSFIVRLNSRARANLNARGRLPVALRVTVTPSGGEALRASKRLTIQKS